MRRLRTHTARLWLLIGLMAWVGTTSAQRVHEAVVQHTRCADHGQLVEVSAHSNHAASAQADANDAPADAPEDEHDQHCDLDLSLAVALPILTPPLIPHLSHQTPVQLPPQLGAPRGPPLLAYAPKTSPPTIS